MINRYNQCVPVVPPPPPPPPGDNYMVMANGDIINIDDMTEFMFSGNDTPTYQFFRSNGEDISIVKVDVREIHLEIILNDFSPDGRQFDIPDGFGRELCMYYIACTVFDIKMDGLGALVLSFGDEVFYRMFYDCLSMTSLSGDMFRFNPVYLDFGRSFCSYMFSFASRLETIPENFTLGFNILGDCGIAFASGMFANSGIEELPEAFNLPSSIGMPTTGTFNSMFRGSEIKRLPGGFGFPYIDDEDGNEGHASQMFEMCYNLVEGTSGMDSTILKFDYFTADHCFSYTEISPESPEAGSTVYISRNL